MSAENFEKNRKLLTDFIKAAAECQEIDVTDMDNIRKADYKTRVTAGFCAAAALQLSKLDSIYLENVMNRGSETTVFNIPMLGNRVRDLKVKMNTTNPLHQDQSEKIAKDILGLTELMTLFEAAGDDQKIKFVNYIGSLAVDDSAIPEKMVRLTKDLN